MASLEIKNLHAQAEDKEILKGLDLTVNSGEVHALMGPNGAGKSTLANAIMGHPSLEVSEGQVLLDGEDITGAAPDERARLGLFMAFQYPVAIPGVTVANFLRSAINAHRAEEGKDSKATSIPVAQFRKDLRGNMAALEIDEGFVRRYLNEGFSGGEKKRIEILQMAMLKPSMAIMDETDSGLDIDALRIVSEGVNTLYGQQPEMGVMVITHYQRLLNYIKPHVVSVLVDGRVVREGGPELALELEEKGYDFIREEVLSNASK